MNLDLHAFMAKDDRALIVTALQALHRERVSAWNAVQDVASLRGNKSPPRELFGIDEVAEMLRRVGAAPFR